MANYLTTDAQLICPHGFPVTLEGIQETSVKIQGKSILCLEDILNATLSGCGASGPGILPCKKIVQILAGKSDKVRVDGKIPLLDTLLALTSGNPPGILRFQQQSALNMYTQGSHPQRLNEAESNPLFTRPTFYQSLVMDWLGIKLYDEAGSPYANAYVKIVFNDGRINHNCLNEHGEYKIKGIPKGNYKVFFPNIPSFMSKDGKEKYQVVPSGEWTSLIAPHPLYDSIIQLVTANNEPISHNTITIEDVNGQTVYQGVTDAQGLAKCYGYPGEPPFCAFVSNNPLAFNPCFEPLTSDNTESVYDTLFGFADDVVSWLWGTIQGDFNEEQNFSHILANALLEFIPFVDTAIDARDLASATIDLWNFYNNDYHNKPQPEFSDLSKHVWLWLNFVVCLVGLFPVLGGVLKAVFRMVRKRGQSITKLSYKQLKKLWEELLAIANKYDGKGNAHKWLTELPKQLDTYMDKIANFIQGFLDKVEKIIDDIYSEVNNVGTIVIEVAKGIIDKSEHLRLFLYRLRNIKKSIEIMRQKLHRQKVEVANWFRDQLQFLVENISFKRYRIKEVPYVATKQKVFTTVVRKTSKDPVTKLYTDNSNDFLRIDISQDFQYKYYTTPDDLWNVEMISGKIGIPNTVYKHGDDIFSPIEYRIPLYLGAPDNIYNKTLLTLQEQQKRLWFFQKSEKLVLEGNLVLLEVKEYTPKNFIDKLTEVSPYQELSLKVLGDKGREAIQSYVMNIIGKSIEKETKKSEVKSPERH